MNFGDTLAKLCKQAEQTASHAQKAAGQAQKVVVDNKHHIHGAVDKVGSVADKTTKGKYSDHIAKVGEKAHGMVDKLDSNSDASATGTEGADGTADDAASSEASAAEGVFSGEASQAEDEKAADGKKDQQS